MTRLAALLLLCLAACGGTSNRLTPDCDPCPFDSATLSGDQVTCSCATGSQAYSRVMEETTYCADNRSAWTAYAKSTCH